MYNKPITQRVAAMRGKKSSALKQTEDTTVLKKEIPTVMDTSTRQLPDTTETITKPGKVTFSTERCGIEIPWSDPRCVAYSKMSQKEIKASEIKQGLRKPDTKVTITKPGGVEEAKTPRYKYDYGDSMPSYMQRKVYRGLKVGERQTKKALRAQLKAGVIDKAEYEQGLKKAATSRANATKAFAETQAEAARQGQMFGKKGTTKIGTFDPNVRISGEEGGVGREQTLADVSAAEQTIKNQEALKTQTIIQNAKNQEAVNKRVEQTQTSDIISTDNLKTDETTSSPTTMKVGPLKMKSSFKMGGYGSKTYKK